MTRGWEGDASLRDPEGGREGGGEVFVLWMDTHLILFESLYALDESLVLQC